MCTQFVFVVVALSSLECVLVDDLIRDDGIGGVATDGRIRKRNSLNSNPNVFNCPQNSLARFCVKDRDVNSLETNSTQE